MHTICRPQRERSGLLGYETQRRVVIMKDETKYAKSGDINIAYQVVGEGPLDLVLIPGWVSHVEHA